MKYKVTTRFIKISNSRAKLKVDALNNILSSVLLRENKKNFSLDKSEKNVVCTGQNLKRKSNE